MVLTQGLDFLVLILDLHDLTVFGGAILDLYWLKIVQCDIQKMPFQTGSDYWNRLFFEISVGGLVE